MTGILLTPPISAFAFNNGQLAAGGYLQFTVGGTLTAIYADSALTTPLPNPVPLNSRGEISNAAGASCQCFLQPNIIYTATLYDGQGATPPTFFGNQIWAATYVNGLSGEFLAPSLASIIDQPILSSFQRTPAEIAAGVTPTNYSYPSHLACGYVHMKRYGGAGDNSTINNAAFVNACLVSGQVDLPIVFVQDTTGIWLFSNGITATGTGQTSGGIGPPVGGPSAQGCRLWGIGASVTLRFNGLSGTTDCITLGSATNPQVELRDLHIDCLSGRDGVVMNGGNMPIINNVWINNPQRDGFVVFVTGSAWVEKADIHLRIQSAGRHGVRYQTDGSAGSFINESIFRKLEIRGYSTKTPGARGFYLTSTATGTSPPSVIEGITLIRPQIDMQYLSGVNQPSPNVIECDSGTVQDIQVLGGGFENTSGTLIASSYIMAATGTGTIGNPFVTPQVNGANVGSLGFLNCAPMIWCDYLHSRLQLGKIASLFSQPTLLENLSLFENDQVFNIAYGIRKTHLKTVPISVTFTASPTGTSGTLTSAWVQSGASYPITFSDGEVRTASLTFNSTAVTWSPALTGTPGTAATVNINPLSQTDGLAADGFMHSSVAVGTSSTGNLDFANAVMNPNPGSDFPHIFELLLSYSQFAANGNVIQRKYMIMVRPDLATVVATQIADASTANEISSIAFSVVNFTTFRVAITTGTAHGTGGGNTVIYGTLARGSFTK